MYPRSLERCVSFISSNSCRPFARSCADTLLQSHRESVYFFGQDTKERVYVPFQFAKYVIGKTIIDFQTIRI